MPVNRLALALIVALAACSDPVGGWEFVFEANETFDLDTDNFERAGEANVSFTLPETVADNTPGAFYRFDVRFERGGRGSEALERVVVRVAPRFESIDGLVEVTTFLMPGEEAESPNQAVLTAHGSLTRCAEDACERQLALDVGWLAPPEPNATLTVTATLFVELRGSGTDIAPAEVAASATLLF